MFQVSQLFTGVMSPCVSGRSESTISDDFPSAFLSPSPEDDDDTGLDFDLDAIETPSDSESLAFPIYDLDLEGERSKVKQMMPCNVFPKTSDDITALCL